MGSYYLQLELEHMGDDYLLQLIVSESDIHPEIVPDLVDLNKVVEIYSIQYLLEYLVDY